MERSRSGQWMTTLEGDRRKESGSVLCKREDGRGKWMNVLPVREEEPSTITWSDPARGMWENERAQ